jgi:hypothetical protein
LLLEGETGGIGQGVELHNLRGQADYSQHNQRWSPPRTGHWFNFRTFSDAKGFIAERR